MVIQLVEHSIDITDNSTLEENLKNVKANALKKNGAYFWLQDHMKEMFLEKLRTGLSATYMMILLSLDMVTKQFQCI